MRRPSAVSKCSIVSLTTAYTICWWKRGSDSLGAIPFGIST
jgi:hypothetical protein